MNPVRISVLTSAVGIALFGMGISSDMYAAQPAPKAISAQSSRGETLSGSYIITFVEPGVVSYKGDVAGLARTAPQSDLVVASPSRKLNVNSSGVKSYQQHLAEQRAIHLNAINQALGRPITVRYTYSVTRNGISADMSAAEAAAIATLPGIKSVEAVKILHTDTFRGPKFIGADKIWDGTAVPSYDSATLGQGVKVGVIDTGTYIGHPSFANDPSCGFSAAKPKLYPRDCTSTDANGVCNGADPDAPPGQGHGVHTASTAAGNTIDNTVTPAPLLPDDVTMSGVAPCATVYPYRTAQADGSLTSAALTAAIENTIIDQVDVVNYSIGPTCGGGNPWDDSTDFLAAESADVFVAASAGNTRSTCTNPTGLVANNGPWMMTVAASTQDQNLAPALQVDGPGTPPASTLQIQLTPGSTTNWSATVPLHDALLRTFPANIQGCSAGTPIPAGYFAGAIAVVSRGTCSFTEKITNAATAGATTVIVANNQAGTISMNTTGVPATVASFSTLQGPGQDLITFVNANESVPTDPDVIFADGFDGAPAAGATGDYVPGVIFDGTGDVLAGFSFRGPTQAPYDNLTKPDITGPGVNIYAALSADEGNYGLESGTSMSSPHVAGAAALVRGVHPNWSPMEVKSALQMTAKLDGVEQDGVTPWTADDVGSGRVDLTKAAMAGLTLNETPENFLAADPDGGTISMTQLNIASLRDMDCSTTCTWTRTFRNRLNAQATWTPSAVAPAGYTLTFSPATFTLSPGFAQAVTITATAAGAAPQSVQFGRVDLTETSGLSPVQHLTVALKGQPPIIAVTPASLSATQKTNLTSTQTLNVANAGGGTLTWNFSATGVGPLWNQPKNGNSGLPGDYSTADALGAYLAADFQVAIPSALNKLVAYGFDNTSPVVAPTSIRWAIYSDAGGKPSGNPEDGSGAAPVWTYSAASNAPGVTFAGTDITLDLVAAGQPVNLAAGTYWLSVYPTYPDPFPATGSSTAGPWYWFQGTPKGTADKLTGGEYEEADWVAFQALSSTITFTDLAFRIEGTVACGAPWLSLSPTSGSSGAAGTTPVTATFNSAGLGVGTYSASACITSNDAANPLVTVPVTLTVVADLNCVQPLVDPSFETTSPATGVNPSWPSSDSRSGTPMCTAALCGGGLGNSGDWFVWFGGYSSGTETGSFSQAVTFPSGSPHVLNFFMLRTLPGASATTTLTVSIDGTVLATYPKPTVSDTAYVPVSLPIPQALIDGAAHTVKFDYSKSGNGSTGNTFIDDVTVDCPATPTATGRNMPGNLGESLRTIK